MMKKKKKRKINNFYLEASFFLFSLKGIKKQKSFAPYYVD
jgi:hypothetical protein